MQIDLAIYRKLSLQFADLGSVQQTRGRRSETPFDIMTERSTFTTRVQCEEKFSLQNIRLSNIREVINKKEGGENNNKKTESSIKSRYQISEIASHDPSQI